MRAIAIEGGVGPPRALKLASIKTPTPKSGEVLIRVAAAGVNYPDIIQREGTLSAAAWDARDIGAWRFWGTVAGVGADVSVRFHPLEGR